MPSPASHRVTDGLPRSLKDFEGHWKIARRIDDRRAGAVLHLDGQVQFTAVPDGLLYAETGTLALADGQRVTASRRYLWRQEGTRIAVFFEDGRPFHSFALEAAAPEATHWCDPDDYRVRYDLSNWPDWNAVWRVEGPRKDYLMTTEFRRG